jgi:hypothetical protein
MSSKSSWLAGLIAVAVVAACLVIGGLIPSGQAVTSFPAGLLASGSTLMIAVLTSVGLTFMPISVARQRVRDAISRHREAVKAAQNVPQGDPLQQEANAARLTLEALLDDLPTSEQIRLLRNEYGTGASVEAILHQARSAIEVREKVREAVRDLPPDHLP